VAQVASSQRKGRNIISFIFCSRSPLPAETLAAQAHYVGNQVDGESRPGQPNLLAVAGKEVQHQGDDRPAVEVFFGHLAGLAAGGDDLFLFF
jgi:hypothetical protein